MRDFESVLAAARDGDEAAFVALFRSVQPALLRYLTTLGGPVAEDAAAETWVSVVKGLTRFAGDEHGFRAWVFTIGHARLRDAQRTAYRAPVPVDAHTELADRPSADDVLESVGELLTTEAALRLIARLPRDQAEAVLLRHVAGLDVARVAEVMGKRPGAVRVATHRGLRRLAALYEHVGPAQPAEGPDAGCNALGTRIDD
ncbi:MAG: RNA polymerase sigma factor [Nocardioidaceae bacterium]|nr:RNA polymerase sigma factor [Nocardioidaceae bacterium]